MRAPRRQTQDFDGSIQQQIRLSLVTEHTSSKRDDGAGRSKRLTQPAAAGVPRAFEAQTRAVPLRENRSRSRRGCMAFSRFVVLAILTGPVLTFGQGASGSLSAQAAASASAQSDNSKQQTASPSSGAATSGTPGQSKGGATSNEVPVGTTICAVLTKTVDAKKAKAGDEVAAKATLAVLAHGKVIIADGAKISGHIVKAMARSHGNPESEVNIVFDRAALKDGGEMPLMLTVQAIGYGGLPLAAEEDPETLGPYSGPPTLGPQGPYGVRHSSVPRPQTQPLSTPEIPLGGRGEAGTGSLTTPALDVGSKGVVGMPGLELSEASEAARGSVVSSSTKDVRLETGSQLVLRVIAEKAGGGSQK